MNVSVEDSNTREAMVQSLLGGALRKELGIESADLQIGLDVARRHLQPRRRGRSDARLCGAGAV